MKRYTEDRVKRYCPHLAVALFLAASVFAADAVYTAKCVGVIDGDTITILVDKQQIRVRLEGVDAPERGQDFGAKAKEYTAGEVFGREVEVRESGRDRYGRTLARIYISGRDLSLELLQRGLAWHFKRYSSDTTLANAELDARARKIGLWSGANPIAPWEWRRGKSPKSQEQPADSANGGSQK